MSLLWWLHKDLREVHRTPHFTVAALPEITIGRIVGTARALDGKTIEAPISGRPCLAYVAHVRRFQTSGGSRYSYAPDAQGSLEVLLEISGIAFGVEDQTGTAIVEPAGARSAISIDDKENTLLHAFDERKRAFLDRLGCEDETGALRFFEGIIEDGERCSIVGYGQRHDGRLVMSSSPHYPLVLCDHKSSLHE